MVFRAYYPGDGRHSHFVSEHLARSLEKRTRKRAGLRSLCVVVGVGGVHTMVRIVAFQFVSGVDLIDAEALRA